MTDLVMSASANAVAHARASGSDEVNPDHLLTGALEAAAKLGVAVFGPLVLDLEDVYGADRSPSGSGSGDGSGDPTSTVRPKYAPATAALFDRAARIAREDGESKVRLVHLLAAFVEEDSELMSGLMARHGFDRTGWRAALAEWDRGSNGRDARRREPHRVLSVDEAAELLGIHAQTVRGYIRGGRLPAYRIGGERVIRIFLSDLYDLLEPVEPSSEGDE